MVDWKSQVELQRETVAYANVIFASFGLYVWEVFQTSDFEWAVLERKRKLKWEMLNITPVPFFISRYLLVVAISALMASFAVKSPINCGALYTFVCVAGNLSVICASITLMLRTIAVWDRKLPVVAALGTLCLAHCALLIRGMFITSSSYDLQSQACILSALSNTNRVFLSAAFWARPGEQLGFGDLLFREGVIYYLAAFTFNAVPAVFSILNLNMIMNLISTVPATVMTVVAATRVVTRLHDVDDDDDDVYVHSATQLASPRLPNPPPIRFQNKVARYPSRPEVHVTTDRIVMEDYDPSPSSLTDKAASLTGDDKSTFNAV
ncbi:hypothetical protein LXA43DRAFT_1060251 [Ganoderma leucocontextum]|nr:hypothetical protein LXA43DRAFT_1060251 [Ganoderma leucocontextum]